MYVFLFWLPSSLIWNEKKIGWLTKRHPSLVPDDEEQQTGDLRVLFNMRAEILCLCFYN